MSGGGSWGHMSPPSKQSQYSLDLFEEWRAKQNEEVSNRGADRDGAVEEEHNKSMLRQNLNAYVCFKELDKYTTCLEEKHLIRRRNGDDGSSSSSPAANSFELNTRSGVNEKLCRATHKAYVSCMSSKANHEAVLQSASVEPHCTERRYSLFQCMRENEAIETQTNEAQCTAAYRSLLRCGLNHLWNRYWREINRIGDADEFHLFELSRDDTKRQEYLRTVTSTTAQREEDYEERLKSKVGYYLNPGERKGA